MQFVVSPPNYYTRANTAQVSETILFSNSSQTGRSVKMSLTAGGSSVGRHGGTAAAVGDGTVGEVTVPSAGRSAGDDGWTVLTGQRNTNCHSWGQQPEPR